MVIDQRRESAPIINRHAITPRRFRQHFLNEQGIDVHQADLQQMERQDRQLLIGHTIGGELAALAVEDEVIGTVPVLDHIEPLVNFAPQRLFVQVTAQENGLDRLAQFRQCLVGRMRRTPTGKAAQDGFRFGRAQF